MIARMILTRIGTALLTLVAVSLVIFFVVELLPGDIAARALGRDATEEAKAAFRQQLRLDRPIPQRYALWLGDAVRGDFGHSLISKRPVRDVIGDRMRNTLALAVYAFALYLPISILLATIAAVRRERTADHVISLLTLIAHSLPEFVVGTALLVVFAVLFPIFPVVALINTAQTPGEALRILALPAIVLTISILPHTVRLLRDNLIEVLNSEYVRMAILKGLPTSRVVLAHALPNSLVPALNVAAISVAYLIGGVVIVEQVFSYPGLGSLLVQSVFLRDAPVVEAVALIVSSVYILGNFVADVLSYFLNPRLRTS